MFTMLRRLLFRAFTSSPFTVACRPLVPNRVTRVCAGRGGVPERKAMTDSLFGGPDESDDGQRTMLERAVKITTNRPLALLNGGTCQTGSFFELYSFSDVDTRRTVR